MSNTETQEGLLEAGLGLLTALLPDSHIDVVHTRSTDQRYDVDVFVTVGRKTLKLAVEIKRTAQRIVWGQLTNQLQHAENPTLLTDYINPALGEKLRQEGINYFDTVGNAYLRVTNTDLPLYIWIEGRKPVRRPEEKADHAFTKAGLRVTYWLMTHPDQVNEPMRTLAQEAGASLETVHRARISLQQRGFLVELAKGVWLLRNRKRLLDKWIEAYATRLQPALLQGRYRLLKNESIANWNVHTLDAPATQWGGEPAADGYTHLLRPAEWTLYTRQPAQRLMKELRLLPDADNGPVRMYEKFWPHDEPGTLVHPLLVYADLLTSQDPRNREVAQKLYETHVQHLLD